MRLTEYLDPELVVIGLDTTGVEDTIGALLGPLENGGRVEDPGLVRKAVLERERAHTTSLGNGVALPHAAVAGVSQPVMVVGTAPGGIEFGPPVDGQTTDRLFFLLLSPVDAAGTHIKLLARIVRLVRSRAFVEALVAAETGPGLVEAIRSEDAQHV